MADEWEQSAESKDGCVVVWRIGQQDTALYDLFVELQNEEASEIPDLFIRFEDPFIDPEEYSRALRKSLASMYDEVEESLREDGISGQWVCPAQGADADQDLVSAAQGLRDTYRDLMRFIVLVLAPGEISSPESWSDWLARLSSLVSSCQVRVMVSDLLERPLLTSLLERFPASVAMIQPDVDMASARRELMGEVSAATPGARFQRFFVGVSDSAGRGDVEQAGRMAQQAETIAREEGWLHQITVIQLTLGAAYLQHQDYSGARACYQHGFEAVAESEDPVDKKVAIQARFSEASTWFSEAQFRQAALVYEDIARRAAEVEDDSACLEAERMACYCHEHDGQDEAAWQWGQSGLGTAERLGADSARNSTAPFLGQCLMRIAAGRSAAESDDTQQRLVVLLGANWEAGLPGA